MPHDRDPRSARGHPPARALASAIKVGDRRVAWVALRRPRTATTNTRRHPAVDDVACRFRCGKPGREGKKPLHQGRVSCRLGLGGAIFGRLGDLLGRSRALALATVTHAVGTGLCVFAQTWWRLVIFRFVAALGIDLEWAIGASLLSETLPKDWRPWIAAVLQTGVNVGVLSGAPVVGLISFLHPPGSERRVFLVGVLPALMVFRNRRHVPETESWQRAGAATAKKPGVLDLFRGAARSVTVRTAFGSAPGLSAWWLMLFCRTQHLRKLPVASQTRRPKRHSSCPPLSSPKKSCRTSAISPAAGCRVASAIAGRAPSC